MPPRFQKPNIFSGQILTTKMKEVFAKALAHYDNREYDKVIKEANLLLKTFPNHAETLCLKGASMYYSKESTMTQSEKDKCLELIQQGCKNNTNSPICWHLLGLFCRAENLHAEAIDALSKSFNINPSNLNVGRDLSAVQMGIFDYEGFTETRRLIFMMRANRQHVLVFAAGNHLLGKYKESLAVIDAFLKTYKPADNTHETIYEDAELYFYKSQILMDMGDYQGTLDFLEENKDRFVDKIAYNTRVAALYEKLERSTDAETQYRWLLSTNTEEASYHTGLRRSVGCEFTADQVIAKEDGSITLPSDKLEKLTQLYKELLESYPKSNAAKRIPLTFLQGNSFSEALESYVRPKISYGVPTLFSDLRELYTDAAKIDTIQKLFISLAENLSASGKFSPEDENAAASESLLWTYFFLASHFDYIGQSDKANEYLELGLVIAHKISAEAKEKLQAKSVEIVDEIKESTEVKPAIEAKAVPARTPAPTCLTDLLMLKAFINKHDGNSLSAYKSMNESRRSDLFDRYLNTRCTKFAFQAGNDKLAESTVFLFLRGGDTIASLRTNQAIWFVLQQALSYADKKNYNRAIQKFTQVEKIYQEYTNEFSDFHGYQARRGTMRTYYDMIKFQKNIRGHKFYVRSASSYIETLLEYRAFKLQGETKLIDAACAETKLDKNDVIQNKLTAEQKKMYDESMDVLKKNRELSLESTRQTEEILYKEHVAEINEENDVIPKTEAEKAKIAKEIGSDPLGYEELKNLDVDAALEKQIDILLTSNSTSISTTILAIRVFLVLGQLDKVPELLEKLNSQVGLYKSATANTVHPVNEVYFHPQSFALHGVPIGVKRKIVSQYHDAELFVLKNLYNLAKARGVDSEQETITTATAEYVREFIADKESITASRIIASIAAAKIYSSLGLDANIDSLFNYITMDKVQSIDVTSASHLRAPLRSALAMLTDLQPSNGVLINTIREFAHEILPKDIKFLTAEQLKSVQADTIVTKPTVAEDAANPPKPKEEIPEPVEPEQPEVVAPKKVILPIATEKKKFGKKRR